MKRPLSEKRILIAMTALCVTWFTAARAQTALLDETVTPEEILPAHVFQNIGLLRNEIEQIRLVVGERPPRSREFRVHEVQPRQVFFQAQTLFRKCNQLSREVAGVSRQAPAPVPDHEISPADVYTMVNASRQQLQVVRDVLGITEPAAVPPFERRRDPSDVMHDLVLTMDVLNQLITERADWPSIYDRLIQVITYAGGVLPEQSRYPALPAHVCCKMPQDVIEVLLDTMEMTRPIAEPAGLTVVRVESMEPEEGGASTDTVYDLTTTLVTDFAELTLRMEGDDVAPPQYERPMRIFPSHAYQLALVWRTQVERMLANAASG